MQSHDSIIASTRAEIKRFDPKIPIESAMTPPASWYLDSSFLELEKKSVFANSWQPVARLAQFQKKGDYVTGNFLDKPYLVIRNERGEINAFYNTCRHHAAELLAKEGCVERLTCPYHGWTYGLSGNLVSTPRMEGSREFCKEKNNLFPIQCQTWGPFVWINMGSPKTSLSDDLSVLSGRLDQTQTNKLHFHSRKSYEIECNWKVYVDNYLDGGYHVAVLHRELASQLSLGSYETEIFERYSIQGCKGKESATDRMGQGALYAWIYPNFMINRYGPVLDTNWIIPISSTRTLTIFDFYFEDTTSAEGLKFIENSIATSERVQQEDVWISESVQRGLKSGAYDRGHYAPAVEQGEHHFHSLLSHDLSRYVEKTAE